MPGFSFACILLRMLPTLKPPSASGHLGFGLGWRRDDAWVLPGSSTLSSTSTSVLPVQAMISIGRSSDPGIWASPTFVSLSFYFFVPLASLVSVIPPSSRSLAFARVPARHSSFWLDITVLSPFRLHTTPFYSPQSIPLSIPLPATGSRLKEDHGPFISRVSTLWPLKIGIDLSAISHKACFHLHDVVGDPTDRMLAV